MISQQHRPTTSGHGEIIVPNLESIKVFYIDVFKFGNSDIGRQVGTFDRTQGNTEMNPKGG